MGIAIAVLSSLGVAGLVMMFVELGERRFRRALNWAAAGLTVFAVSIGLYSGGDVDWTVWLIPGGLAVAVLAVGLLVS